MNSHRLNLLIKNINNPSVEDFEKLRKLITLYPYSQVLYVIQAIISKELNRSEQNKLLQIGAVYSADRAVFKNIMDSTPDKLASLFDLPKVENSNFERTIPKNFPPQVASKNVQPNSPILNSDPIQTESATSELRNHILEELEKLKLNKHNFTVTLEQFENSNKSLKGLKKSGNGKPKVAKKTKISKPLKKKVAPKKIKVAPKKIKVAPKKKKNEAEVKEILIPTKASQKISQAEIIDKFIGSDPKIPKSLDYDIPIDLSEDFDLDESISSETLVEILIKQGKKEKAIEMLNKMILKFPKKKLYFAHQIKELNK